MSSYKSEKRNTAAYTVSVQQGDNMAPILFLFVMQAFSETLEDKWEK
jgi:hypothetical protein